MAPPFRNLVLDRPLAVLDLETTGTDPATDRIVDLAIIKTPPPGEPTRWRHFAADGDPVPFRRRVDPERPIPAAATAVHRIGNADIVGLPTFAEIAPSVALFLEDCDLAGFGIRRFDLPLLCAEFDRVGVSFPLEGRRVLDALPLYHARERRDLSAAARFYCGIELEDAHDPLIDVLAACAVLDAMVMHYPDLPMTVAELHEAEAGVDVQGRFRRDGKRVVFAFGKHAGRSLRSVASSDPGYLRWLLRQPLLWDARSLVERALSRTSAER